MKTIIAIALVMVFSASYAATKCERDYSGGICCWDTETEGVFKPINC